MYALKNYRSTDIRKHESKNFFFKKYIINRQRWSFVPFSTVGNVLILVLKEIQSICKSSPFYFSSKLVDIDFSKERS